MNRNDANVTVMNRNDSSGLIKISQGSSTQDKNEGALETTIAKHTSLKQKTPKTCVYWLYINLNKYTVM